MLRNAARLLFALAVIMAVTPSAMADNAAKSPDSPAADAVTIVDRGTYFDVVFALEKGATHRQLGEAYGEKLRLQVPEFEQQLDSYISENCTNWLIHKVVMYRIRQIKKQIPQDYRDEIEGIASKLSGGDHDERGDGKVSENELYLFNLLGDVARLYQCSAVGVYGNSSATGSPIVGRNFDWPDGKKAQLANLQAVLSIKNGTHSFANVGCLGFQGAVSAFNNHGVFAAVLDSPTGAKYSPRHKRSYLLDLRQALENCTTLDAVADWMEDPEKHYAVNHIIMLADKNSAAVLENNISGKTGSKGGGKSGGQKNKKSVPGHRQLRTTASKLRDGVTWDIPDTVGCVNCFQLDGSDDNQVDPWDKKQAKKKPNQPVAQANLYRWQTMKTQLSARGPKLDRNAIKETMSYYHPESRGDMYKGDLYNVFTIQSMVFEPQSLHMEVAFRPRNGTMPARPAYEEIPIHVQPAQAEKLTESR